VPFGKFSSPAFPTLADLERAATLLRGADLHCGDWKAHVDLAGAGDLVFLDPPYPGTFQGYATAERPVYLLELVRTAKAAWQRGAGVVCTLPDTEEIQAHFEGWCAREPLTRRTGVAAVASARGALSQAAFISIKR
jgi:DNA adenine methylase